MSSPAADARGIYAHAERSGSPARRAPHTRSPRGGTQRTQTPAPESGRNPAPNSWLAVLSSKCANFPEAPSSHVRTGVTRQWSSHSTELLRKSEGGKYFTLRRVTLKSLYRTIKFLTEERLGHQYPHSASRKSYCTEMSIIQLDDCKSGFLATI